MNTRTILSSALALVVATGLLAGCGSKPATPAAPKETAPAAAPAPTTPPANPGEVNIYTARHYAVDDVLYADFTKQTGIKVNIIKGTAPELIERMKREGTASPADLFLTVDGGVLNTAKVEGILQPIKSAVVEANVPKNLRDSENQWVALSSRARVIAYAKDRVKPEQLSTYEDLATAKWKGKVTVRSSTNMYNQSLVASLIALNGEKAATDWAAGISANLSRKPEGGDRDQIKALAAGIGDVAIVNTYYVGQMLVSKDEAEVKAAQSVGIFFPNQQTTGTHINISGAGLAKNAKNTANAVKLVEYLTSQPAQETFAKENHEYPVNPKAVASAQVAAWGTFKAQQVEWAKLGEFNKLALQLMDKANWK